MMMTAATKKVHQQRKPCDSDNGHFDGRERIAGQRTKPWHRPYTVLQYESSEGGDCNEDSEGDISNTPYVQLKQRLALVPSMSKHTRQTLYVDLWTGQHWLGLKIGTRSSQQSTTQNPADTQHSHECARNTIKKTSTANQTDTNTRSCGVTGKRTIVEVEKELLKPISADTALSIASSAFGLQ